MKAYEIGEQCFEIFKERRMGSHKNQVVTVIWVRKKRVCSGGKSVMLRSDRFLFGGFITMDLWHKAGMASSGKGFSRIPLDQRLYAVSSPLGLLCKTNRAALAIVYLRKCANGYRPNSPQPCCGN